MSAYRDAFSVNADSSDEQIGLAEVILATRAGVVLLNQTVALRASSVRLLCEVIDPTPSSRRCDNEYEVLVENAQGMLAASPLGSRLPNIPRRWVVVEDTGTSTVELWHAT